MRSVGSSNFDIRGTTNFVAKKVKGTNTSYVVKNNNNNQKIKINKRYPSTLTNADSSPLLSDGKN